MDLLEVIRLAASESGLARTESCCGVGDKYCETDVWKGNLEGFAKRLLAIYDSSLRSRFDERDD